MERHKLQQKVIRCGLNTTEISKTCSYKCPCEASGCSVVLVDTYYGFYRQPANICEVTFGDQQESQRAYSTVVNTVDSMPTRSNWEPFNCNNFNIMSDSFLVVRRVTLINNSRQHCIALFLSEVINCRHAAMHLFH